MSQAIDAKSNKTIGGGKCVFIFYFFFIFFFNCVWNVLFDTNQLIYIHRFQSETYLKKERKRRAGWLRTIRSDDCWGSVGVGGGRIRDWAPFFFLLILFSAFRAEFPDRREHFFVFLLVFIIYLRRNSWVVSTFFARWPQRSFLFWVFILLRPFAPWVADHPCPGAVVPWTSTTTAAVGQKNQEPRQTLTSTSV